MRWLSRAGPLLAIKLQDGGKTRVLIFHAVLPQKLHKIALGSKFQDPFEVSSHLVPLLAGVTELVHGHGCGSHFTRFVPPFGRRSALKCRSEIVPLFVLYQRINMAEPQRFLPYMEDVLGPS